MTELVSQADLQQAQSLPFCYLCGRDFKKGSDRNRDHVPPKAIFSPPDRDPPLILPTCPKCNEGQSEYDEQIGQLIAVSYGKVPRSDNVRLSFVVGTDRESGDSWIGIQDIPLPEIVWRWIRGFHAALYREFLSDGVQHQVYPPFPHKVRKDSRLVEAPILPKHKEMADVIRTNRATNTLDRIRCFNDKCTYECVWIKSDRGVPICIFAVKIYAWEQLADRLRFPERGCVGYYIPEQGRPANATLATDLVFDLPSETPLDPFR